MRILWPSPLLPRDADKRLWMVSPAGGTYRFPMHATAWHNGGESTGPAGYGIRFDAADRDRHFAKEWDEVVLELEGGTQATVNLSPSFWRVCSELRSAEVGRWLLDRGAAPWQRGNPPTMVVTPIAGNRFSARLLKRHVLPGPEQR